MPSCKKISTVATKIPRAARMPRVFSKQSRRQATRSLIASLPADDSRRIGRGGDRNLDIHGEIRQMLDLLVRLELHAHLDHARIGPCRRIDVEDVVLEDHLPDLD